MTRQWRLFIRTQSQSGDWHEDFVTVGNGAEIGNDEIAEKMTEVRHGYGWVLAPQEATVLPCFVVNFGSNSET